MAGTTSSVYHGGSLNGSRDPYAAGLWATNDRHAAQDYADSAATWPDGPATVHRIEIPEHALIISLDEACERSDCLDAEIAQRVAAGEPDLLAAGAWSNALADDLVNQGVWAVHVPAGDEHPDTGREHASLWIVDGDAIAYLVSCSLVG
jgi:hypothetical protein